MVDLRSARDKSEFYRRLVSLGGGDLDRLTRRDPETLRAVAAGLSNQGIREALALA